MWRFYGRVLLRIPSLLLEALKRLDAGVGMLTLVFGAVGFVTWQQLLPWWSPFVAFGAILFYGFLSANYEEYANVDRERGRLQTENDEFGERASAFRQVSWVERENEQLKGRNERLEDEKEALRKRNQERQRISRIESGFAEHCKREAEALKQENERLKGQKDAP